jgi:hypothetical protein
MKNSIEVDLLWEYFAFIFGNQIQIWPLHLKNSLELIQIFVNVKIALHQKWK